MMEYFNRIQISKKLFQNYNNLLVLAIIIFDAISNLLQYIDDLEDSDEQYSNSDQVNSNFTDAQWIIRFVLLSVILFIIIINFICKKYFKKIQPYRLYLEVLMSFVIVEYFIQQIESYQKKSQVIVVYVLVNQRIFVQIGSFKQKFIFFLFVFLSFIYLEVRLFASKQFSYDLLIFSLEIFVCLMFSLCFCYDFNSREQEVTKQKISTRKISKINLKLQSQKSTEQIKKYEFSHKSIKQLDSFYHKNSIQGIYGDSIINQDSLFSEKVFKSAKLQNSQQNSQKTYNGKIQVNINKQNSKTNSKQDNVQNNEEIDGLNYQEFIDGENNILENCVFHFISFQGIAIFDMQQTLVFENQQLPFMLNGFEKKETTQETILSIKLQKYLVQMNDQILQSGVIKTENLQDEPILDPQSIQGNQSDILQKSPNNFEVKQIQQSDFNQQNMQPQNQVVDKMKNAIQEQDYQINKISHNKNKINHQTNQNYNNNLSIQNNIKNNSNFIDVNNINYFSPTFDDIRQITKNTNDLTLKTAVNIESCFATASSKCDKPFNFDFSNNQVQQVIQDKLNMPQRRISQNQQKPQDEISYIESFNSSLNQQLLGQNIDEKNKQYNLQHLNFQTKQNNKEYSISSQTNFFQNRNFHAQEQDQQILDYGRYFENQYFKKKKGFKSNIKLIELLQSNQDCTIKEILNVLLQSESYISKQVNEKINNEQKQNQSIKFQSENQKVQNSYQDTFASFSYKNGETNQVSSFQRNSKQNNKNEKNQKQFEYFLDDDSILIRIKNDKSNVIFSIKIIVLSLQRITIDVLNKFEELYAFFELQLQNSDQQDQHEIKIEEEKLSQEIFSQVLNLIEKKYKNIIEPSISRIKIYQENEHLGILNQLLISDHKKLFTTPFINSILLFNNQLRNLQDYSLISQGQFELEYSTFSIVELLINCTKIFSQQSINQNVSLDLKIQKEIKQTVTSDYKRLQQVFINILSNTVDHTHLGKVQVFVTHIETERLFKITINDNGKRKSSITNQKLSSMFNSQIQNQQFDLKKLILIPNSHEIQFRDTIVSSQLQKTPQNTYSQNNSSFSYSFAGQEGSKKGDEEVNIGFNLFLSNYIIQKLGGNHPISQMSELEKGQSFTFCIYDNQNQGLKNGLDNFKQSQEEYKIQQEVESAIKERYQQLQQQKSLFKHQKGNNQFNEQIQPNKMKERNNEQKIYQEKNVNSKTELDSYGNINIKRLQLNNNAVQSPQYKDLFPVCNNSKQDGTNFTPRKHTKQLINQNNPSDSINNKNQSKQKMLNIQKDSPNRNRSTSAQNQINNFNTNNPTNNRAINQVKSQQADLMNGVDLESCNVASEKNSSIGLVSTKNYQNPNVSDINIVTNKKKDLIEKNENRSNQKKMQNNVENAILVRRSKSLQPIDVSSSRWKSKVTNPEIQYDTYQFGIDNQATKQTQKSHFYLEHNDYIPVNQQNPNRHTTTYYYCENPMVSSNSNQLQNDSFNNISPSLNNFFTAGKSQNLILYNSPNARIAAQDKDILNPDQSKLSYLSYQDLFPKQKTIYNRSQTVRQAYSEFVYSDPRSQFQKSSEQSIRENEIQKYFCDDDSPLFLQSYNVFKANGEEQLGITKKLTDFGHQTSVNQISPTSISKKKQNFQNIHFKRNDCGCNSILILEGIENNLSVVKNNLQLFKLKADMSTVGAKAIKKIKNKLDSSQCCPKYKLIFIDVEPSQKKAIKVAKEITSLCSLNSDIVQPFICSCAPNQAPNNQILYGEGFDAFDYALQKPIDTEGVFVVLDTALI